MIKLKKKKTWVKGIYSDASGQRAPVMHQREGHRQGWRRRNCCDLPACVNGSCRCVVRTKWCNILNSQWMLLSRIGAHCLIFYTFCPNALNSSWWRINTRGFKFFLMKYSIISPMDKAPNVSLPYVPHLTFCCCCCSSDTLAKFPLAICHILIFRCFSILLSTERELQERWSRVFFSCDLSSHSKHRVHKRK